MGQADCVFLVVIGFFIQPRDDIFNRPLKAPLNSRNLTLREDT
jgi:hypothetical protein